MTLGLLYGFAAITIAAATPTFNNGNWNQGNYYPFSPFQYAPQAAYGWPYPVVPPGAYPFPYPPPPNSIGFNGNQIQQAQHQFANKGNRYGSAFPQGVINNVGPTVTSTQKQSGIGNKDTQRRPSKPAEAASGPSYSISSSESPPEKIFKKPCLAKMRWSKKLDKCVERMRKLKS